MHPCLFMSPYPPGSSQITISGQTILCHLCKASMNLTQSFVQGEMVDGDDAMAAVSQSDDYNDDGGMNSFIFASSPLSPGRHQFQSGCSWTCSLALCLTSILDGVLIDNQMPMPATHALSTFDLSTLGHVHNSQFSCTLAEFPRSLMNINYATALPESFWSQSVPLV